MTMAKVDWPTFDQWSLLELRRKGLQLCDDEQGLKWQRGRVLAVARRQFGDEASVELMQDMSERFGVTFTVLNQERWVAEHYPSNAQIFRDLTWTHHRLVAAMDPSERAHMLRLAVAEQMSVAVFREWVRSVTSPDQPLPYADPIELEHDDYVRRRLAETCDTVPEHYRSRVARATLRASNEWHEAQMREGERVA